MSTSVHHPHSSLPLSTGALDLLAVGLTVAIVVTVLLRARRSSFPGPKGLPWIGVGLQIPSDKQWLKFHEWILQYGASSCLS